MSILALLSYQRVTKTTTVFEGPGTGIRTVYVESDDLPIDQDPVMAVVESMKMENEIISDYDGTVSAVHVEEDQSVSEGDPLVEVRAAV